MIESIQSNLVKHPIRNAAIVVVAKLVAVIVPVAGLVLVIGPRSINAHDSTLLVVAVIAYLAAILITILGAAWIVRSVRQLISAWGARKWKRLLH
jgi:hypothetical protein